MKITFLTPPVASDSYRPAERSAGCTRVVYPIPNIYELTAAAVAEKLGHDVRLESFTLPKRSVADFHNWVKADDSDIYCIWGVNLSMADDLPAIDYLLKAKPNALIMMMGPAPTFFHKRFLTNERIFIARGEPEGTFAEWLAAVQSKAPFSDIKGLSYFKNGKPVHNPMHEPTRNFDNLPFPARHLLAGREFHNPKVKMGPYTTMLTSRNCPYHCIYCVPSSLTFARELDHRAVNGRKPPISYRSPESVEAELKMLHEQGYKAIGFVDDNFIWNEERTLTLCALLKKYGFKWGCQARVDAITEPIAKALGESGCTYIDLGVESFNDEILKYIKKGFTVADIHRAISLLQKYNVPVKLNVLIGTSPLETRDTIRHTVREAKKLKVDQVMINIISPFPGTELYDLAIKNGWIVGGEYRPTDVQRESILSYPQLTARQMEKALFRANLTFFTSPSFIIKQMRRFSSPKEFTAAFKALKVKLFG
ncbi:MAG: B12-binding domain-containing radical SAM protein [Prevotella sp.]|nr:B12-binding domain-containing radical SAM protein [Prevotella sp.]MCM1075721.1 B12-binding domain-containing radical SAM protein [Ruminococcus sp.]